MKFASYGLALVVITGLGIALPFSSAQMTRGRKQAAVEKVVYVDRAKLTQLHPAWNALQEMKSTLAQVQKASSLAGARMVDGEVSSRLCARDLKQTTSRGGDVRVWISRQELETEAARAAMRAFEQSKVDALDALSLRISSMKSVMLTSAEAARTARTIEIESGAAKDAGAVDKNYAPGRLKAQLKLSALQASADSDGIDSSAVEAGIRKAQAQLEQVDSGDKAEKNRIAADLLRKIDALKEADEKRIAVQLSEYESREDARIRKNLADARDETLLDLSGLNAGVHDGSNVGGPAVSSAALGDEMSAGLSVSDARTLKNLRAMVSALENRIREDVDRAARSLAAKEGVKISLTRGRGEIEDATPRFRDKMRGYLLRASRPVLSEARGS